MDLASARELVSQSAGMDAGQVAEFMELLTGGSLAEADGGALLVAWAERGETAAELAALVRLLREQAVQVPSPTPGLDLCGTGGSGLTRFNISTTAAFILAACGVPVAKHGNFGSTRPNGSFNLLQELGVAFELPPAALLRLQAETGLCFLFARIHHPVVGKVVPYRKAAARRTIFNLAGPLANPAPVRCQLIGTADPKLMPVIAEALQLLEVPRALVVHGAPGIDECSVVGSTQCILLSDGQLTESVADEPLHPNLDHAALPGGDAPANAVTFRDLLGGSETGPMLDMVCINAGVALDLWHDRPVAVGGAGYQEAKEMLATGKVMDTFERHRLLAAELACTKA